MERGTSERICLAILVATLCSGCSGQWSEPDWLSGLSRNIEALNRDIQENVRQVNQQVQETVRDRLEQARQRMENLDEKFVSGNVQIIGSNNNAIVSTQDGIKFVNSGHTSDGKPYTRETTQQIEGDVLRHVLKVYYPATNTTAVHGFTLDLKDPNAKPVPINGDK